MSSRSLELVGGVAPPAGFFDRTFRKGKLVRCSAVLMIAINYALFIIGFMTAVYGLRLGSQEFQQMEFLRGELDGNVTMASELYLSVKQSSGLTQGLTMLGILAVIVATLGVCGSVRGSPKCLYCYAVSSMGMLVVQSIIIAMLNFSVQNLDATVKTVIQDSDAAKDLVRQNGQQALYVGLFAFTIEVVGFAGSLLAREALNQSMLNEELKRGIYESDYDDDDADLTLQLDELDTMADGHGAGVPDGPAGWLKRAASMRQHHPVTTMH